LIELWGMVEIFQLTLEYFCFLFTLTSYSSIIKPYDRTRRNGIKPR